MKTIFQTYEMNATPEEVFNALTDPAIIENWSGAPAEMDDQEGSNFSLWNGDIHGKNLEIARNQKLVQEWYGGKWEKPSKATFTLTPSQEGTTVTLEHEEVPENSYDSIDEGWKEYYLGPMQKMFENK